jgi:hypothetical protein
MTDKIDRFSFSFTMASKAKESLEEQLSTVNSRIEKIVDHFTINDLPILRFILNMDPSKDDLKKVAKAIDRLSDLVEIENSISSKLAVITTAEKDPNWFALAFGDFESEIDEGLKKIFEQE